MTVAIPRSYPIMTRDKYTRDLELRQEYRAICRAIDEAPEPVADEICE